MIVYWEEGEKVSFFMEENIIDLGENLAFYSHGQVKFMTLKNKKLSSIGGRHKEVITIYGHSFYSFYPTHYLCMYLDRYKIQVKYTPRKE